MAAKNKENKAAVSVKRPLSPHLSIYRPQITSVLSITHRMTGVFLFFGVILFCWWIVLNVYGCGNCITRLLHTDVAGVILILCTMALYYHLLNGIRHLFWDMGKGYSLKAVTISGWAVLVGTVILTAFTWVGQHLL